MEKQHLGKSELDVDSHQKDSRHRRLVTAKRFKELGRVSDTCFAVDGQTCGDFYCDDRQLQAQISGTHLLFLCNSSAKFSMTYSSNFISFWYFFIFPLLQHSRSCFIPHFKGIKQARSYRESKGFYLCCGTETPPPPQNSHPRTCL